MQKVFVVLIVDNLYGEVQSPLQFLVESLYNQVGERFVAATGDKKVFQCPVCWRDSLAFRRQRAVQRQLQLEGD